MKQANNLKLYNFMNIMSKFKQVLNFLSITFFFYGFTNFQQRFANNKNKNAKSLNTKMFNNIIKKYNVL